MKFLITILTAILGFFGIADKEVPPPPVVIEAPQEAPKPPASNEISEPVPNHPVGAIRPKLKEFSLTDITRILSSRNFTPKEKFIIYETLNNKTPTYDLTKISQEEIINRYERILRKMGDELNGGEKDLAERIKIRSRKLR